MRFVKEKKQLGELYKKLQLLQKEREEKEKLDKYKA